MRFSRKFLDVQHRGGGEGISRAGNSTCAKSSGGRSRRTTREERGKLPLRVRREGRLYAPPCRLHGGSNAGLRGGNAFFPVPDAESAGIRRPPLPRPGNSPCSRNAFAAPAETQGAEWADGDRRVRRIKWKAREASATVRMRPSADPGAHAHAGHASRALFANATAAIFLRSLSNADILYCSYIPTQNMLLQLFYADILYCSYTHITYSQRPPHSPHPLLTQS